DLAAALALVLKEKTAQGICTSLAHGVREYVLRLWPARVHVLLAQKNREGSTVLAEVGSLRTPLLELPLDRGMAAAVYTLPSSEAMLACCPTTLHCAFDPDVDGPVFSVDAGGGILAVPLEIENRRIGAVLATGTGMPCGTDHRRRALFATFCSLCSQPLVHALEHKEAPPRLPWFIPELDRSSFSPSARVSQVRALQTMLRSGESSEPPPRVNSQAECNVPDMPVPPRHALPSSGLPAGSALRALRPLSATPIPPHPHVTANSREEEGTSKAPVLPRFERLANPMGSGASRPGSASSARWVCISQGQAEHALAFIKAIASIQQAHSAAEKQRQLLLALSMVCGGEVELLPPHVSLMPGTRSLDI
ncbi:MAG: hypothetical protein SGPRY_014825, partial [Prymnesium sp.]